MNVRILVSPSQSRPSQIHPEQTSKQLAGHLGERLHSSYGQAAWNGRHGRETAAAGRSVLCPESAQIGCMVTAPGYSRERP
jgi:hypothetical protein